MKLYSKEDSRIAFIGDPHLGKEFITGVPLNRRGEREASQRTEFLRQLTDRASNVKICVGDIFDKFTVPAAVTLWTAAAIEMVALEYPDDEFYFLMGNHDASRDVDKRSSFDILRAILAPVQNVVVVADGPYLDPNGRFVLLPWHPFKTAEEIADGVPPDRRFDLAVGHWDITDFGDGNTNVIPYDTLSTFTSKIVTGHDHTPRTLQFGDMDVTIVGSMMPYSHGEDPSNTTYVTMAKLEYESLQSFEILKNKCVRILLQPGEQAPDPCDCLQFTVKTMESKLEKLEVKIEEFNLKDIFDASFKAAGVSDPTTAEVWTSYTEKLSA